MRKMIPFSLFTLLSLLFSSVVPFKAQATETSFGAYLPGYRDFMTGIIPPKPGFYFRNDFRFYDASVGRTIKEDIVSIDLDTFMFVDILTSTFVLPGDFFGAKYALGFVIPVMSYELSGTLQTPAGNVSNSGTELGLGDIILMPLMLGWNKGNFYWNFTTAFILPTGKYNVNDAINTSLNYITIDPELGFTWFDPKLGVDISTAIGYSVNFENQTTQYESGDAFHLDFAGQKIFRNGLHVGAVGYAWVQVNGDSGAGAKLGPFKGRVFGAGPALGYDIKIGPRTLGTMFKYYREFGEKNHFAGNVFNLALTFGI